MGGDITTELMLAKENIYILRKAKQMPLWEKNG
jgi:hypothetical protein